MKGGSRFRFRLERVRELRQRTEDEAKRSLAEAMAEHFRAEELLREAELQIESHEPRSWTPPSDRAAGSTSSPTRRTSSEPNRPAR